MFSETAGRLRPVDVQPNRILSVKNYGLTTNYTEDADYTLDGRKLVCNIGRRA